MPRLIPRGGREEELVRATRDVHDNDPLAFGRPLTYRGEIASASDPRVKADPDMWEPLPPLEKRPSTPGRGEPAAVAHGSFFAGGRLLAKGDRLWADDPLVRAFPQAFYIQRP